MFVMKIIRIGVRIFTYIRIQPLDIFIKLYGLFNMQNYDELPRVTYRRSLPHALNNTSVVTDVTRTHYFITVSENCRKT